MARKLAGLERVLDTPSLAAVAYGEIASSLYLALGVIALEALGLTPWILLVVGLLFGLVALSYAEGTSAFPETGGAATFVRRAFNDFAGFITGWALFLDYLIVIALAALFLPHYLGHAVGWVAIAHRPWDAVVAVGVIGGVALVRLVRRPSLYRVAIVIAGLAFVSHVLLIVLGFAFLFSLHSLGQGAHLGVEPSWRAIAFALPLSMLAFTGLETVANLAAETREPGRTLPRSLFLGIGAAVVISVLIAVVGISGAPAHADPRGPDGYASDLGTVWLRAPLLGIVAAFHGSLPNVVVDGVRVFIGLTGSLILVGAITTSMSGAGRLAYSMGRHAMLPHAFGLLNRRTLIAPVSLFSSAAISAAIVVTAASVHREVRFLASLYSFGVLLAFTAAQIAVVRLRFRNPTLYRPFRVPGNVRIRGTPVPVAALIGAPLTFAIWIAALATHGAARAAGSAWLLAGAIVYVLVRRSEHEGLLERVHAPVGDLHPAEEGAYCRILVPLKIGAIGEEVLATALKLADEEKGQVNVLHVIRVPLDRELDVALAEQEERAWASLEDAKELASEHGVEVAGEIVRARALGEAIVRKAGEDGTDLIVLGSAPRWRRQSRFFSPTVDYVLRKAPCEVMVVAYPQGVLDEDGVGG